MQREKRVSLAPQKSQFLVIGWFWHALSINDFNSKQSRFDGQYVCVQVTVIIPFINEYDFLEEAISSVLTQSFTDLEIIVVGNDIHSPDETRIRESANIRILHEPNPGAAFARNTGLHAAKGDWVQFLDVDDLLLPGKIEHQLNCKEADLIVAPHLYQYLNGRKVKSKFLPGDLWVGLLNSGLGSTSSMLWRKKTLDELGGWNIKFQSHQEYELIFRCMAGLKKVEALDLAETIVRERKSGSITKNTSAIRAIEGIELREAIWRHLQANGLDQYDRYDAFRQYLFRSLRGLFKINRKETMEKYREYFHRKNFMPKPTPFKGYCPVYRSIGFEAIERLINIFV